MARAADRRDHWVSMAVNNPDFISGKLNSSCIHGDLEYSDSHLSLFKILNRYLRLIAYLS